MYRLLIVDDEPIIVDGLVQLFENNEEYDIDIRKAYSAFEALEIVKKSKIDVMLSDIRMPKMNGLQLLDEVLAYWPSCKAIFLTGYSEFDYVYSAIKKNSVDYILKTEGDEAILESVEKAFEGLRQEEEQKRSLELANNQLNLITPMLKKALLESIIFGEKLSLDFIANRFEELGVKLDENELVFVLCAKVANWNAQSSYSQKVEVLSSIQQNLLQRVDRHVNGECVIFENSRLVWLLQPIKGKITYEELKSYVKASLELMQDWTKDIFNLDISFVLPKAYVPWENVNIEYEYLVNIIDKKSLSGQQLVIDLAIPGDFIGTDFGLKAKSSKEFDNKIRDLQNYLDKTLDDKVEVLCREILHDLRTDMKENYLLGIERYYTFLLTIISYVNQENMPNNLKDSFDLERLLMMDLPIKWESAEKFFVGIGRLICMYKSEQSKNDENNIIEKIHSYINQNISGDLSLTRIAELVYFNPSYLSRFYKQLTGRNLSEYINNVKVESAKKMLGIEQMKISEISSKLGFEAPSCFTAFFKKMARMTPQEYRDSVVR